MRALNLREVEEMTGNNEIKRLPAGGYVCVINEAHSNEKDEYIEVVYDIHEGEFAKIYSDEFGQNNAWAHNFRSYWKGKAIGMFKHFLSCIDKSNGSNFVDLCEVGFPDEALKGRIVGIIFGEEEYMSNKGEIRVRIRQNSFCTADEIRQGNFKVPELKKYVPGPSAPSNAKATGNEPFMQVSESDLPQEW